MVVDSLNHTLFLALNASSEPPQALVIFAIFIAKYLILLVPLHIALVWSGGTRAMRFMAITSVLALLAALAANQIIGLGAYTPRPFVVGIGNTLIDHRPSFSFPSNHGTVFFTYAITLGLFAWGTSKWDKMGPWNLGEGTFKLFAILSIIAMVLIFVLGIQPPNDWALYITVGFLVLTAIIWFGLENRRFKGPPIGDEVARRQAEIAAAEKAVGEV